MGLAEEIDSLRSRRMSELLHRVAVPSDYAFAFGQMNMDASTVQSLLRGRARGGIALVKKMIEDVFSLRLPLPVAIGPHPPPQGRYSKGYLAFYGGLELETSKREVDHWVQKRAGKDAPLRLWYAHFEVNFIGHAKDLRDITDSHPELMADSDYSACQKAGAQIRDEGIDALLSRSVRNPPHGSCMAVFNKACLSAIRLGKEIGWRLDLAANKYEIM